MSKKMELPFPESPKNGREKIWFLWRIKFSGNVVKDKIGSG